MGVSLYVYVGPYIKCHPFSNRDWEKIADATEGRLSASSHEGLWTEDYSVALPDRVEGISRPLTFQKNFDNPCVIDLPVAAKEMHLFEKHYQGDIAELEVVFDRIEVSWGIVPYWY